VFLVISIVALCKCVNTSELKFIHISAIRFTHFENIYIYICLFYLRFKCSYVGLCTVAPNNFVEKKFHGKVIIAKSAKKFSIFVHIEDHKSAVFSFSTFHAELPLKRNLQRH
jgi:hypothetical protein